MVARFDRRLRWLATVLQWPIVGGLAVLALALGYAGFALYHLARGEPTAVSGLLYKTIQLFKLESGGIEGAVPWQLDVARWLAPAVAGFTVFKALASVFKGQLETFRIGRLRDHVVVCGLGQRGFKLARALRREGLQVVVVELDAENDFTAGVRSEGAFVRIGDARDPKLLRRVRVHRARHLVAVSGDDGVNAEVALHARRLVRGRRGRALACQIQIADPHLCALLQIAESEQFGEDPIRVEYFNLYDVGASLLLREHPPFRLAEAGRPARGHVVVLGLGRFGESVVRQTAHLWRLAGAGAEHPLQVTVVDRSAKAKTTALEGRESVIDEQCKIISIDHAFDSSGFQQAGFLFADEGSCDVTAVYVCPDDDSLGLLAAMTVRRRLEGREVPVVVRMVDDAGLATLLRAGGAEVEEYRGLHAFGLLARVCTPGLLTSGPYEKIGRGLHEDYVRRQEAAGRSPESAPALVPWEELAVHSRESNRDQAAHTGVKLRAIGCELLPRSGSDLPVYEFTSDEVEKLARLEHRRWVAEKRRDGWRLGARAERRKRHPDLVPWTELPKKTRQIDRNFIRALPAILDRAGYAIVRSNHTYPVSEGAG